MAIYVSRSNEMSLSGGLVSAEGVITLDFTSVPRDPADPGPAAGNAGEPGDCWMALNFDVYAPLWGLGAAWPPTVLPPCGMLQRLRVRHQTVKRHRCDFCSADVHYATESARDIVVRWAGGVTAIEVSTNREDVSMGTIPASNPPVPKTAVLHVPTGNFFYTRTECDQGYYDGDLLIPWNPPRKSWGEGSDEFDSQRRRVHDAKGKVNQVVFLGNNSDVWLFNDATADQEATSAWDALTWRVTYQFGLQLYKSIGWKFPDVWDNDTPVEVYLREDFTNELQLTWPILPGVPGTGGPL